MVFLKKHIILCLLLLPAPLFLDAQEYLINNNGDTIYTSVLNIKGNNIEHVAAYSPELQKTITPHDSIRYINHQKKGILKNYNLYSSHYVTAKIGFALPFGDYADNSFERTSGHAVGGIFMALKGTYFLSRNWGITASIGYFDSGFDLSGALADLTLGLSNTEQARYNLNGKWESSFIGIGIVKGFNFNENMGLNVGALLTPFSFKKPNLKYTYTNTADTTKFTLISSQNFDENGNGGFGLMLTSEYYFKIIDRLGVSLSADLLMGSATIFIKDEVIHEYPSFTDSYEEFYERKQDVVTLNFGMNIIYFFNRAPFYKRRKDE